MSAKNPLPAEALAESVDAQQGRDARKEGSATFCLENQRSSPSVGRNFWPSSGANLPEIPANGSPKKMGG